MLGAAREEISGPLLWPLRSNISARNASPAPGVIKSRRLRHVKKKRSNLHAQPCTVFQCFANLVPHFTHLELMNGTSASPSVARPATNPKIASMLEEDGKRVPVCFCSFVSQSILGSTAKRLFEDTKGSFTYNDLILLPGSVNYSGWVNSRSFPYPGYIDFSVENVVLASKFSKRIPLQVSLLCFIWFVG